MVDLAMETTRSEPVKTTIIDYVPCEALTPGSIVLHTYQILSLLNKGGMGEVYKARHQVTDTLHAIKIIRPELVHDPRCLALFRREAKLIRTIQHDAVVGYDGLLRDQSGRTYLIMEFIEGPTLGQYIQGRGELNAPELLLLATRLVQGIAAFHAHDVIHRDLTPDNIILSDNRLDQAKVIDFGIAKQIGKNAHTIIGQGFAGKFIYAAPEQMNLSNPCEVDARADFYSLGMVLLAAAQGKRFNRCKINQALAELPRWLSPVISSLVEQDPNLRPQSANALLDQLRLARKSGAAGNRVRTRFGSKQFGLISIFCFLIALLSPSRINILDLGTLKIPGRFYTAGQAELFYNQDIRELSDLPARSADRSVHSRNFSPANAPGDTELAELDSEKESRLDSEPTTRREPKSSEHVIENRKRETVSPFATSTSSATKSAKTPKVIDSFQFEQRKHSNPVSSDLKHSQKPKQSTNLPLVNMPWR